MTHFCEKNKRSIFSGYFLDYESSKAYKEKVN